MELFAQRELPDYATPISLAELVMNEVYFITTFVDERMMIPEMTPVFFIGEGHPVAEKGEFAFQDASSFLDGLIPEMGGVNDPVVVHTFSGSELNSIYTFNNALNVVLRCSCRRERSKI